VTLTAAPPDASAHLVRAPKTAELISTLLRNRIVRGELKPGDTLPPEPALMNQFGVSRPTLREGFRILEAEQLITIRRGARGGAVVTHPDKSVAVRSIGLLLQVQDATVGDVYEARMTIEPACARLLARARTADDLADLEQTLEQLSGLAYEELTTMDGALRWSDLTSRFHLLIMERCGNQTLALQGAVLADITATHIRVSTSSRMRERQPVSFAQTLRSYQKLVNYVEARNGQKAEEHWRLHMKAAAKILLRDDLEGKRVVDLFT
jgi:GntR family transcriptional repressor for pyruvate dehydrogenase complex